MFPRGLRAPAPWKLVHPRGIALSTHALRLRFRILMRADGSHLERLTAALPRFAHLERLTDQRAGLGDAVELHKRAEARALGLAEQHLVEGGEPIAQRLKAVLLAHRVDLRLDFLGENLVRQRAEPRLEIGKGGALLLGRCAVALRRLHEVMEITDGVADELVEQRVPFRCLLYTSPSPR